MDDGAVGVRNPFLRFSPEPMSHNKFEAVTLARLPPIAREAGEIERTVETNDEPSFSHGRLGWETERTL